MWSGSSPSCEKELPRRSRVFTGADNIFFDDFVTLATVDESAALRSCVHLFFKMLGWMFAESGQKAPDFAAAEFQTLGVSVSVRSMHVGVVELGNTDACRRAIIDLVSFWRQGR